MNDGIRFYEVGGAVRDEIMGRTSSDVDFTAVAPSWEALLARLERDGFKLWQVRPEFFTVRAGIPEGHPLRARTRDADFVWARRDGEYKDGRRPTQVFPGTLEDDLRRRDFTCNAVARDPVTGKLYDPTGGVYDIARRTLRFVGNPEDRIREDGLRVVRAYRFMVTHDMRPDYAAQDALRSPLALSMVRTVVADRRRVEINKMLAHSAIETVAVLVGAPRDLLGAMLDGINLLARQSST